jgi:hypothetical protein
MQVTIFLSAFAHPHTRKQMAGENNSNSELRSGLMNTAKKN